MAMHTPGPWAAVFYNREPELPEGVLYRPAMVRMGEQLLRISDDTSGDADARLIAAAPDLLEALQAIVHRAQCSSFSMGSDVCAIATAAIARATGGQ
jgi:hypothetical protein